MALWHKGLEADFIPVQLGQKNKIAFSGQKLVPVLREDDGRVIHDSWTIACYLEDAYGDRPSLFGGAAGRAGARFLDSWVDSAVHPALIRFGSQQYSRQRHRRRRPVLFPLLSRESLQLGAGGIY